MSGVESSTLRVLSGEQIGRVPFWEVWFAMGKLGERLAGDREGLDAQIHVSRQMGWDVINVGGVNINSPGGASGAASDGTTHYIQGGVKNWSAFEKMPWPDWTGEPQEKARQVAAVHQQGMAAVMYLPWAFHRLATAMGWEHFALKTYDDMDFLHRAFDWVEERVRAAIQQIVVPARPDFVLFDGDCAYKNGLMVRPDVFRELTFERTKGTVELLREAGILYTFHSDGKVDDFMPMLIELGFAGVHGIEAQANDLADIKRRFGRHITLIGNMDVVFLSKATVDQVREATENMLRTGCPGGRYIAACNTSPLDYIPEENYLAMAEVIRNFRF